ncbi:cupin-like domain-containing protein [Singulisphaera sp. Ch08]|uniref:Cupin-like domain-containing protein n=1 Tax=Singulisphaera sp. Ch08 TaxID=3120278 RepID=A0AAU7CD38_9BACT
MGKSIFDGVKFAAIHDRVKNQPRRNAISRFGHLDCRTFLCEVEPAGYPVIFRHGPAANQDTLFPVLRERHGGAALQVRVGDYADSQTYPHRRHTIAMTFAAYLDAILALSVELPPYVGNQPMPPGLLDDLGMPSPPFHPADRYEPPALWLGPAGAVTPLHKDGSDNFAAHVFGSKRWVLFPVRDASLLAMERVENDPWKDFAASRLDMRGPGGLQVAIAAGAVPIEVFVNGGETLYLPAGWGHFVENVAPTLMVNTWLGRMQTPGVLRGATDDHTG